VSTHTRPDPPSPAARPHFPRLAESAPVPLLTTPQLFLLLRCSTDLVSLLDCEFSDAIALKVADLVEIDRATDRLTATDAGRRFLAAGP